MLLLQSVRKYFEIIGIYSPFASQSFSKWNWRIVAFFISLCQLIISSIAFMLIKAETAAEYGYSFCQALNGFSGMANVSIFLWKRGNIFKLLERFEAFVDRSEYDASNVFNAKITLWTFTLQPQNVKKESENPSMWSLCTVNWTIRSNERHNYFICVLWTMACLYTFYRRWSSVWPIITCPVWATNHLNYQFQPCKDQIPD